MKQEYLHLSSSINKLTLELNLILMHIMIFINFFNFGPFSPPYICLYIC